MFLTWILKYWCSLRLKNLYFTHPCYHFLSVSCLCYFLTHHPFFRLSSPSILFWKYATPTPDKNEINAESYQVCFITISHEKRTNKQTK